MPPALAEFGSAARPLRASALSWLVKCPVQSVMQMLEPEDDAGGPAAQTGNVVHAAVAAFHLEPDTGKKVAAAVAELQRAAAEFPQADPAEARLYLEPYLCDPRNQTARIVAVERPVSLTLDPHPLDPTGQPIVIRGKLDQIREEDGKLLVDDLKTGARTGWEMVHDYAYQQAAYALASRASGFPTAEPGRIIRVYGYRTRGARLPSPDGVFFSLPFDVAGARTLLDRVRLAVALVRRGEVDFGAGSHCTYCPLKGLDSCIPAATRRLFTLPVVTR